MQDIKKYVLVDSKIFTEGSKINFTLFHPNKTKTQMTLILQKDTIISANDKIRLLEVESLYILEEQVSMYKKFVDVHLKVIAADINIPIEEKAKLFYKKASSVIEELFHNPQSLENSEACEGVVDSFISLVKDDNITVSSLMQLAAHDYCTHTHSINVSIYSIALGNYLRLSDKNIKKLATSSILHDLGKSTVDYEIINKNGKLTDEEFNIMKHHPGSGYDIAKAMGITDVDILSGIRHHHEKMDGNGYPDHLVKSEISLFARIIGLCDIFDALSTKRSYKDPMSTFESLILMKKDMSSHVDLDLLKNFIEMMREDYNKI